MLIRWLIAESRGVLLVAMNRGAIKGGAVVGRCGRRCWYIWGASDKEEHFSVGPILQWKALLWAKSNGCTEYDFGGYTPGATSGPALFKAGFGGREVTFIPPYRTTISPLKYRIFSFLSRTKA
jgi:lipid II:glycine glycyltransferase (peptidoglycan interpeptide bridge formation enzyme)